MQRLLAGFARTTERSISTSQFLFEPPEPVPEWRVWSPHAAEPRRAPQTTPSRARTLRQSLLRRGPLRSPPEGRLFGSSDASSRVQHQGWSRVGTARPATRESSSLSVQTARGHRDLQTGAPAAARRRARRAGGPRSRHEKVKPRESSRRPLLAELPSVIPSGLHP